MAHLIYLGCPYSHPNPEVQQQRFEAVTKVAGIFMTRGQLVFSPVTHSHPVFTIGQTKGDWGFWGDWCVEMLLRCDELVVLSVPGWKESVGLNAEMKKATEFLRPISFCDLNGNRIVQPE